MTLCKFHEQRTLRRIYSVVEPRATQVTDFPLNSNSNPFPFRSSSVGFAQAILNPPLSGAFGYR
jgi:hypothetical protein